MLDVVDTIGHLPELARRLTGEATAEIIRAEVARLQAMAADPVMLTLLSPAPQLTEAPAAQQLVVQHRASGLRGQFTYRDGTGWVYAKPYAIESVDPTEWRRRRGGVWWRDVTGLGIGERIYLHAAQPLPEVRWDFDGQSPAARALRAKLHERDPWRWHAATCLCRDRWQELTPQSVVDAGPHDRPAGPLAAGEAG